MKRVVRLTERDLTRIVRRIVNEGDGFKSNKKEDQELEFALRLDKSIKSTGNPKLPATVVFAVALPVYVFP